MAYVVGPPAICPRTNCFGNTFALRKRMKADGRLLYAYQYQCLTCGMECGTRKASEVERLNLPTGPWDDSIYQKWWAAQQVSYNQKKADEKAEWFKWYNAYLTTPEWKAKREKVLDRAKGLCEGCGNRRAIQSHHLTYEHVGNEFLWELVAVCEACHLRFHEAKNATSAKGAIF
ncbi:MAG: hypothetical protein KGL39_45935 [Patescibacteria group bacterium]|nr:hypothetical protein [Patescibacteria group bacterium]